MKKTFEEIFTYIKHPTLITDENTNINYRISKFLKVLLICIITAFIFISITAIFEELGFIKENLHKFEKIKANLSFFLLAVVFAPLIEELIFRAPLVLFNEKYFKYGYYSLALVFGYIHIFNYEINTNVILFSPLLIAPQIFMGLYFGFIRVKFGLTWSVLMHSLYNLILITPYFIAITYDKV